MSGGDRLYELLPAIHRVRDAGEGEPLRALLRVMERELAALEIDAGILYQNWFVETCEEWVVPYLGDLLGVRSLEPVAPEVFSQRAFVANTLRYRRRKGTAAVLEQLALDLTGWSARAVEMFERLIATQHVNHPRAASRATADLRAASDLELVGGPLETATHTAEVRRIGSERGRYDIPNVALFLWRLQSYPVTRGEARPVEEGDAWRYRFHPVGLDAPLFNPPRTEEEIDHLAEEVDLPGRLRWRPLSAELEARRRPDGGAARFDRGFFSRATAPFRVVTVAAGGAARPIPPEEILICDLGDRIDGTWPRPPAVRTYTALDRTVEPPRAVEVGRPIALAVDPVRGRLALPEPAPGDALPERLEVSYRYGFAGDVGGGPYDRRRSVEEALPEAPDWQLAVSRSEPPIPGERVATLTEAVAAWNVRPAGTVGVIAVTDSATYRENLTAGATVEISEGSTLVLVAAGWPASADGTRRPGRLSPERLRPHLAGDVSARGTAPAASERPGTLVIDGLLTEGRLRVLSGALGRLVVSHATLVPGRGGLLAGAGAESNDRLEIEIRRSIVGRVDLGETGIGLTVTDSLVDPTGDAPAVDAPESEVTLAGGTLLGALRAERLAADDSLLIRPADVRRLQEGCVRFSYVAEGSRTPRRYRCQPELEIDRRLGAASRRAAEAGEPLRRGPADDSEPRPRRDVAAFTSLTTATRATASSPGDVGDDPVRCGGRLRDGRLPPSSAVSARSQPVPQPERLPSLRSRGGDLLRHLGASHERQRRLHPRHVRSPAPLQRGPVAAGPGGPGRGLQRAGESLAPGRDRRRRRPGSAASPRHRGYRIEPTPDGSDLLLFPGRLYAGGVLAELEPEPEVAIAEIHGTDRVVLAPEALLGVSLDVGDWVVVVDDEVAAAGEAGTVVRVLELDRTAGEARLSSDVSAHDGPADPRLRRLATYTSQPDLPAPPPLPGAAGWYLLYLDVWRHQ